MDKLNCHYYDLYNDPLNFFCFHSSIIVHLWEISIDALSKVVDDSHKKHFSINNRLLHTLKSLREFYHHDGDGVSMKVLDSERYRVS